MTIIELEIHDDVVSALNKVRGVNDSGIELVIPDGSIIFDNLINLKLLKKESGRFQKTLHLTTKDPIGLVLIESLMSETSPEATMAQNEEVISDLVSFDEPKPSIKVPKTSFKMPTIPTISLGGKQFIIYGVLGAIIIGMLLFNFLGSLPKAYITLSVKSENLTRSVQIKVKNGTSTDAKNKQVRGLTLTANTSVTASIPTTGQSFVGNKAVGKAKVFNKTSNAIELKKGTLVTYSNNNKDYNYVLKTSLSVPAATENVAAGTTEPPVITPGEAIVEITAEAIGPAYNQDASESLAIKGYKKAEMSGVISEATIGGSSKTISVVAEADKTKLSADTLKASTDQAAKSLQDKLAQSQKFIQGSTKVSLSSESFNKKVGEETSTLTVTQEIQAQGLVYYQEDMDKVLDTLTEDFVPSGFKLSDKERAVDIQVLGTTANTILSEQEADLQATLKTFIVPDVTEAQIVENTKGKSVSETQNYLQSIKQITNFSFKINPTVPFFPNVPSDEKRIIVEINRE